MNVFRDKRGYTLIELIIVMGIMAVFAGGVAVALGYSNQGRTKKAATSLNDKLSYIQTQTMTLKGETYLYVFKRSDGVYAYIAKEVDTNGNGVIDDAEKKDVTSREDLNDMIGSAGEKLCGSSVEVSGEGGATPMTLDDNNMIKIGYSKSTGAFICCNDGSGSSFYNTIKMSGREVFTVMLVQKTGKHYIQEI